MNRAISPLFDIAKTFTENVEKGPFFHGEIPKRPLPTTFKNFLGFELAAPLGVAACSVMFSQGIRLLSSLGFDVLTYKTIRAAAHPVYPFPNIHILEHDAQQLTIANSFGIGSPDPEFLKKDIALAKSYLKRGQVLIVSIYGEGQILQESTQQFCKAAALAKEAGADVIEVNLSCPNVINQNNQALDEDCVFFITHAVKKQLGETPFIVKLGIIQNLSHLQSILKLIACAGARGVSGINSIKQAIINKDENTVFGEQRRYAGVSGSRIKPLALDFIRQTTAINQREKLDLKILGMGGITQPEHFDEFLEAGADIALSATGALWNPYLAYDYYQQEMINEQTRTVTKIT